MGTDAWVGIGIATVLGLLIGLNFGIGGAIGLALVAFVLVYSWEVFSHERKKRR